LLRRTLSDLQRCDIDGLLAQPFTVRSLMCTPVGPNLCNKIAHGMADTVPCFSGYGVYAWRLILALVMHGYHLMLRAEQANRAVGATEV